MTITPSWVTNLSTNIGDGNVGWEAGKSMTTGSYNILIGNSTRYFRK